MPLGPLQTLFSWMEHIQTRRPRRHSSYLRVRRKIAAVILLGLLLSSTSYFWYFTTDERIRQQTTQALERITGGTIKIEHASLDVLRQIRIRELKVYLPEREPSYQNLIFSAKDVILYHKPWSILSRRLRLDKIVAYEPDLHIGYDYDRKQFNIQQLHPMRGHTIDTHTPQVILEQGSVRFSEYAGGKTIRQSIQKLRGRIDSKNPATGTIDFSFLRCDGVPLDRPLLVGSYNPQSQTLKTTGRFPLRDMIELTHLPHRVKQWEKQYQLSDIAGEVTTHTHYDPNMGHIVQLHLSDGQIRLPVPLPEADIPLQDVEADIRFTHDQIRIDSIRGRYQNLCTFSAHGTMAGYSTDAALDISFAAENLEIPETQWAQLKNTDCNCPPYDSAEFLNRLGPPLQSLFSLVPADIRRLIHTYSPTGTMDLQGQLRRSADGKIESYGGTISCKNVRLLFNGFPYPLEEVKGQIRIAPGEVTVGPLVSNRDDHRVVIDGLWQYHDKTSTFEITIDSQNTPLDPPLYGALKPWQQKLWDDFQPTGRIHARYDAAFETSVPIHENLHIQIHNADVCYRPFPVPVTDIYGTIDSNGKQIRIEVDRARAQSGELTLKGNVDRIHSPEPEMKCRLGFRNVVLDETFGRSLPAPVKTFYTQTALQGRADGSAILKQFPLHQYMNATDSQHVQHSPIKSMEYEISATLKDGHIRFSSFPYPLHDVLARIQLTNETLRIESLRGKNGISNLTLYGELEDPNHYYFHVEGSPIELTQELAQAMGERAQPVWEQLHPSGLINVTMDLSAPQGTKPLDPNTPFIIIQPTQCRIVPKQFSYPLWLNEGEIRVFKDKYVLDHVASKGHTPNIVLAGVIGRTETEPNCHLNIAADSLRLDPQFGKALPPRFAALYETMEPNGIIDLNIAVHRSRHAREEEPWEFEGEISVVDGSIHWPIPMENIHTSLIIEKEKPGTKTLAMESDNIPLVKEVADYISISKELPVEPTKASYDPKTKQFHIRGGKLSAPSLSVMQRDVTQLQGTLNYEPQQLALTELSGYFCKGQVAGELSLHTRQDPVGYELKLQCTDADLKTILTAGQTHPDPWEHLQGHMTGWLNVRQSGEPDKRRGSFLFIIRDAVLGELPIPAQILHVLNLSLPKEGAFNEASLAGDIVGEKIRFDPIHLRGSAVALTGAGIMTNPSRQLELVFMVDSPHKLPKIPIITSFFDAFKGELAQVWVTGTFHEPKVEPVAFPTLEDALRQLSTDLPPPAPKHRPTLR